jgi:hypothetical protein
LIDGQRGGLPSKAVQPGDTWSFPQETPMGPYSIVNGSYTVTFQSREKHAGRNCARLEFECAVKARLDPKSNPTGPSVNRLEGTIAGVSWFDPELGMGIGSAQTNDMKLTLNRPLPPSGNPAASGATYSSIYQWIEVETTKLER